MVIFGGREWTSVTLLHFKTAGLQLAAELAQSNRILTYLLTMMSGPNGLWPTWLRHRRAWQI